MELEIMTFVTPVPISVPFPIPVPMPRESNAEVYKWFINSLMPQ